MNAIQVLIADDSVVYRSQIREALEGLPNVQVVGTASNGKMVFDQLSKVSVDLLILDLEMPEMDGLSALKELKQRGFQGKVLVFSGTSRRGAELAMEAMRQGASDFVTKLGGEGEDLSKTGGFLPSQKIRSLIEPKIKALFEEVRLPSGLGVPPAKRPAIGRFPAMSWRKFAPQIVLIGASTGGPTVLERIFAELSVPLRCPIVIVQHMPPIFTAALAERLGRLSGIRAVEASDGMILESNCIYVAPGDYHLRLKGSPEKAQIALDQLPPIHSVRPAVDPAFESAASLFKDRCLAFVLTGMGEDGARGAERIKEQGGAVVIQDEASCVVFGMPGKVYASGAFDREATPREIIGMLKEKVMSSVSTQGLKDKVGG